MRTAYISHPDCLKHDTGLDHPENAARLYAINDRIIASHLSDFLHYFDAPVAEDEEILLVHSSAYLQKVKALVPAEGHTFLDPDTVLCPHSLKAARRATGAVILATDLVLNGDCNNAFCAVRPPGHHAEADRGMGFCIFNNIAAGAAHALKSYKLDRIVILDFDVHQGNGTEQIFLHDDRVMYCSSFQYPFYPDSPLHDITDRIVSIPLSATITGDEFREVIRKFWIPAIEKFEPQMLFVSAGFDAHQDDDMSDICLTDSDFDWITDQIIDLAKRYASGRIVSVLEGGYERNSLARCVVNHVRKLAELE